MDVRLNTDELELLLEALNARASRRDSMARFSRFPGMHHELAADMRKLYVRLDGCYQKAIFAYNRGEVA